MSAVKLYDIRWVSHTAGPSPITTKFGPNARVELFFMGCKKAANGNPCKGCFNSKLWKNIAGARELNPKDMAEHIWKFAPQRYITIVGGEPMDQPEGLTVLCEELRKRNFHIIVFTHYTLKDTFKQWKVYNNFFPEKQVQAPPDIIEDWTHELFIRFLKSIDVLVDGEYDETERIYDENLRDGLHDAVGSSNQIIWDLRTWRETNFSESVYGQLAENVLQVNLREKDNSLVFLTEYNSFRVFPLTLNNERVILRKHTRWYMSSFDTATPDGHDDFWQYYYLLRYKADDKTEQDARNDIKRDIKAYGTFHDIDKDIISKLCDSVDDPNLFKYNKEWLNTVAKYFDKGQYESELNRIKEECF